MKRLIKKAISKTLIIVDIQKEFAKFFNEEYLERVDILIKQNWDRVITIVDDNDEAHIPRFIYEYSDEILHKSYGGIDKEYIDELIQDGEIEIVNENDIYRFDGRLIIPGNIHENFLVPEDMEMIFKQLQTVTLIGGADQECLDDIENSLAYLGVKVIRDHSCIYDAFNKNNADYIDEIDWVRV